MSKSIFDSIENSSEFKESFKILLNNFINYIIENPDIFLFIEQFNNSPLYNKIPQEYYDDLYQLHDSFYQKGKEQNLLKDVSIYLLTVYTYYPVVQLIKTYFSGEVELTDSNIESVLQMSWDAIKV
ncbi:hypothetical protein [Holzapfeliella floricola]|nr:hypothetical protein [Holzapfeliella floricola]